MPSKIKVLIVDDSPMVRRILADCIAGEPDIEVVGTAPDPYVARDLILKLSPDVITLDIEMPRMDGLTFLQRLMHYRPTPTIIVSSLGQRSSEAALDAMRFGAVEVLCKPNGPSSVGDLRRTIAHSIRAAAVARLRLPSRSPAAPVAPARSAAFQPQSLVCIGASTGGTIAIQEILSRLPADIPPVVIAQHIPAGFSLSFANRLNRLCAMEVREAVDGDELRPGLALLAPGDLHMLVRRRDGRYRIELQHGPQVCFQRPSVDVLFASAAQAAGAHATAMLLTGMGTDGARGLLALKQAGAATIAQDEASCVVFGMPREAIRLGAAAHVAALDDIPHLLTKLLSANLQPTSTPRETHP